ncbi:MAG: hypothetical protein HGA65_03535 [Oscillochloris sp.]|nr:hypothetical protein [Oscillochloris sp.]
MTNERFGRLVSGMINAAAAFSGKNARHIEEEIAERVCLSPLTIQGYKGGRIPKEQRTIEVLAEFGVKYAYLNREWLQRLLASVHYYNPQPLLEQLAPLPNVSPHVPPACDNLPAPDYSSFIMRPQAYTQLVEGLNQRTALVVILSMGGMGKSSLALEVAKRCIRQGAPLAQDHTLPAFDTAVWVAAHEQAGGLSLSQLLDTIALTLGHPGVTRLEIRARAHAVGQLLRQQHVLIIVDGAEASSDHSVLNWLLRLPEPSKALVTTRIYRQEFQCGAWLVELTGMSEVEAQELVDQTLQRLHMRPIAPEVVSRLWELSGGNPKAIEMALGQARHTGRPLAQIIDTLLLAQGELFETLFACSWGLLGSVPRTILAAAALFVGSSSCEALLSVSGVDEAACLSALQKLSDLSLIERVQSDDAAKGARYALHPLTRSFVSTKGADDPDSASREHWLTWCLSFASSNGGYVLDDLDRLSHLDSEEPTLFAATGWAMQQGRYTEAIRLVLALEFYYYVRAIWGKKLTLHRWYIEAARQLGDSEREIAALALHIQLLSQQGQLAEVANDILRLHALAEQGQLAGETSFNYHHTLGIYAFSSGDPVAARSHWEALLGDPTLVNHMRVGAHHWLGRCLRAEGDQRAAHEHFTAALEIARRHDFRRLIARNQIALARLAITAGDIGLATQYLAESQQLTVPNDCEQLAHLHAALGQLAAACGQSAEARAHYIQARSLLERMGLAHESTEVEAELAQLE